MLQIKSPLLDSVNITLTRKIKVAELIRQWKYTFNIDITNEMHENLFIEEYRCNVTQLFFFKPNDLDGGSIMYEALQFVLEFGFKDMNCHSIEAVIDPENVASERLLQKCDFVKEAHFKENCFWNGQFLDSIVYSKLKKY